MKKYFLGLALIIFIHLFFLSKISFFPYPELFIYPYLTANGLTPYKEIFDQHFPGLMFFPINLHTLGMTTPEIAQVWHWFIVGLTHVFIFLAGKKIFKSEKMALASNLLFAGVHPYFEGYVLWIDTFMPLFLIPAFLFLTNALKDGRRVNFFLSGFFIGLALMFKQVVLPIIGLLLLFLFIKKKFYGLLYFFAALLLPVLVLFLYISSLDIWKEFIYWTITFNLTIFNEMATTKPSLGDLVKMFPIFVLPLLLFFSKKHRSKLALLLLFYVFSLVFAYARFDFVHLQPALPFATLLVIYFINGLSFLQKRISVLVFVLVSLALTLRTYDRLKADSFIFYSKEEREVARVVKEYASPGEAVLAFATLPHINQMTETLPPGKVFVFPFPWFSLIAQEKIVEGLVSDPPKVVVQDRTSTTQGENLASFMPAVAAFVDENYIIVESIGNNEILVKKGEK